MPIHDWTQADDYLFYDFHRSWIVRLSTQLNCGGLPPDHFALIEQKAPAKLPDLLKLELTPKEDDTDHRDVCLDVATSPPKTGITQQMGTFDQVVNRLSIRNNYGDVVAAIEVIAPSNKRSIARFRKFVEDAAAFLETGISLLVIDLLPPTKRDPFGVHKAIWDEFDEQAFDLSRGKDRMLASYDAGPPQVAYVENIGVGDPFPDMPIFLRPEIYVNAPLESTYQEAWAAFPRQLKGLLEKPAKKRK